MLIEFRRLHAERGVSQAAGHDGHERSRVIVRCSYFMLIHRQALAGHLQSEIKSSPWPVHVTNVLATVDLESPS